MMISSIRRFRVPILALLATAISSFPTVVAQVRPPNIAELTRYGLQQGTTAVVTVYGTNLRDTSAVLFDDERLSAKIVGLVEKGEDKPRRAATDTSPPIGDVATRGELTIEITAAPGAPVGGHLLRLRTPLGATPARVVEVGALSEIVESEPNDEKPEPLATPSTVNGEMGWPGDVDLFVFDAAAGQQMVFAVEASGFGSRLDSRLVVRDESGAVVASNDDRTDAVRDALVIHTFDKAGRYVLDVADSAEGGGANAAYRLTVGVLPYVTSVFPLGGVRDRSARFALQGANLGATQTATTRLTLPEKAAKAGVTPSLPSDVVPVTLDVGAAKPLNEPVAARGVYPEITERDALSARQQGQLVTLPVTINGRIDRGRSASTVAPVDAFRFPATKNQKVVFSVQAARLGSPLDATLEVVDIKGRPIPRAVLRPVWETSVDLRDRGSQDPGLRFLSWSEIQRGDYVFVDRELMRVRELPKGPDEDVQLMNFRGRRFSYEGTSGEGHALTRPIYKVEIHPPGTRFSPNGLPLFTLDYRNDDGGPFYGKDPYLEFTAPATGEYVVRLRDSRGESGPRHAYRLAIAPPRPDFTLAVSPANPNVPQGGRIPVQIFAFRHDGFDGPIAVELQGLPPGIKATRGVILPGHTQVAVTLEADDSAPSTTAPFTVHGEARVGTSTLRRSVDLSRSLPVVSIVSAPPLRVAAVEPAAIELRPGESAKVRVKIERQDGFKGRVPVNVQNLPFLLTIPDIGLNGILITEQQDSREFTILADPKAPPMEQTLYLSARAEVNGGEPIEQASTPITIRVLPARPGVTEDQPQAARR